MSELRLYGHKGTHKVIEEVVLLPDGRRSTRFRSLAGTTLARQIAPAPLPVPEPHPAPEPPTAFSFGLNANSDWQHDLPVLRATGVRVLRTYFHVSTPGPFVADRALRVREANGTILPLAEFHGSMPTAEQARKLRDWALLSYVHGVRLIEFGNETSYGYQYNDQGAFYDSAAYQARAALYGMRALEAAQALVGTGVGLLVQADDGGTGSGNWVREMLLAAPDLKTLAAGWTVHPYGPNWRRRLDKIEHEHLKPMGVLNPAFHVTEYGFAADNGRMLDGNYGWPKDMRYSDAAAALRGVVEGMRDRVESFFVYQSRDQRDSGVSSGREHYFGVCRRDGSPKGEYTAAVKALA